MDLKQALARSAHASRTGPMLSQVAEGVLIHQSELLQNNAVVVQGGAGVLLIDPGITGDEMACLANDLRGELGQPVVAGFGRFPSSCQPGSPRGDVIRVGHEPGAQSAERGEDFAIPGVLTHA
jgi:hypothetical protein